MTTYIEAVTSMQGFFNTGWDSATPIVWGEDDATPTPSEQAWVRFNITHNDGGQATMGSPNSNRFRHFGIITVQVFYPQGNFGIEARNLANNVLELYQGAEQDGIYYYDVRANEIGNDSFGWYQINVVIEFRYDNIT